MSIFVESVRQLYIEGKIRKELILEWYRDGKITIEERTYILEVH